MKILRVDELEGAERWEILVDGNRIGSVSREADEPKREEPRKRKRRKFKREPRK